MISRDPNIQQGAYCIAGTRIPVRAVKSFAKVGYEPEAIQREYPSLTVAQIEEAIAWRAKANDGV